MFETLYPKILALLFSLIPFNLLLLRQISKFLRYNPRLGKTTVILTELPGVLTKSELIVRNLLIDNYKINTNYTSTLIEVKNLDNKDRTVLPKAHLQKEESVQLCAVAGALCSYERLKKQEEIIQKFFLECGLNKQKIRGEYSEIQKIPSNDEKKFSTTVTFKKDSGEIFAFSKGNPYKLLAACNRILLNGKKVDLNKNLRAKIKEKIDKLNKNGEKAIAFAFRGLPLKKQDYYSEEFTEHDMIFLGAVGLVNPINGDIKESIAESKKLGIKTYIFTSQLEKQAIYAGNELEVINPTYNELHIGEEIREMNEQKLKKILTNKEKDYIFAEMSDEDKEKIILTLKELDENTLVIDKHQNTFDSVIENIKKARQAILNEPKLIYHGLSIKAAQFSLIFGSIILGAPLPLSATAIIIFDIFISLPLELILKTDLLNYQTKISKFRTILRGSLMGLITLIIFVFLLFSYGWNLFEAGLENDITQKSINGSAFILLVILQILNIFRARGINLNLYKQIAGAKIYLFLTIIITGLFTYSFLTFNFFGNLLKLGVIDSQKLAIILFSAFIFITIEEIFKLWKSISQKETTSESK